MIMDTSALSFIFQIAILVMSVVIHEVSHGFMAYALGDPTAKYAGRLTLNPIPHIDPFGSIILPFVLSLLPGGIVFGYAKPVPYNPYNLRDQKWGPALVAGVGPLSNLFVAFVFGLIIRFGATTSFAIPAAFFEIASLIVLLNIVLAVFNLVPIPPLDGSRVLFTLLPYHMDHIRQFLEQYGYILLLVFIFFFFHILHPIIEQLFYWFTGLGPNLLGDFIECFRHGCSL
ncbi:MAG: hypothetical protein G01um101429_97 [Parcubacteria group bacterium Gr01-1014_29]|nr:MAG: hypothetical protein G01um101429_97 [Parcubacteria group bacterium Gr01-1014_29]